MLLMDEKLVTKAEFADVAGVSSAAITKACKPTKTLAPACVGKRININHPEAQKYIEDKKPVVTISVGDGEPQRVDPDILHSLPIPGEIETSRPAGYAARNNSKKAGKYEEGAFEVPEYIGDLADKTLRELIEQFGTDVRFVDWLKATKEIEVINEKRIKNAQTEGQLVSRDLVKKGIIDPFNSAHIKLLTDGAKTIARRATAMHDAETPLEDIEKFVADQITSFLRPIKTKVARALKDV